MQCKWCGRTYTNGYGGGYCSRRCYEEGHRRTCKGCGCSFTGAGYSGSGIVFGAGGDWCSEACYRKNATSAQKKIDAATAKFVLTVIFICIFPPLLIILYWKQVFCLIKWVVRILLTRFFWKYVVPIGAIVITIFLYIDHRDRIKAYEEEMARFAESANEDGRRSLDKMREVRIVTLEEIEKQRQAEARAHAEKEARQKAEVEAAIAVAEAERHREQEVGNIEAFAKERLPETYEKLATISGEMRNLEERIHRYRMESGINNDELESDAHYIEMLISRNKLTLKRRMIEDEIAASYRVYLDNGDRK